MSFGIFDGHHIQIKRKSLTGLNYCSFNYSLFLILSYWRYDLYSINWWMSYLVSHIVVTTIHHDILIHTDNFFMLHIPRYIWNTSKVGAKHQSIIQSSNSILSRSGFNTYHGLQSNRSGFNAYHGLQLNRSGFNTYHGLQLNRSGFNTYHGKGKNCYLLFFC
jgi:hypothetical protein